MLLLNHQNLTSSTTGLLRVPHPLFSVIFCNLDFCWHASLVSRKNGPSVYTATTQFVCSNENLHFNYMFFSLLKDCVVRFLIRDNCLTTQLCWNASWSTVDHCRTTWFWYLKASPFRPSGKLRLTQPWAWLIPQKKMKIGKRRRLTNLSSKHQ